MARTQQETRIDIEANLHLLLDVAQRRQSTGSYLALEQISQPCHVAALSQAVMSWLTDACSAQNITVCPFRVVDEINQGMDPINERKVFKQLVDAACRDGTPQCFLLTPKLLPGLGFRPNVTVIQIMNGTRLGGIALPFSLVRPAAGFMLVPPIAHVVFTADTLLHN